jgi:TIR domain
MPAPKVFISYSHDSATHKGWVLELASFLRTNGIDVVLDQWDVRLGKDLPKFMEDSVSGADRVLAICTERYVQKADGAVGGVGYEKMIVTAELIKDLGTSKFIPVIRQAQSSRRLPKFLGARSYVDFSDGVDVAAAREQLLRELHDVPPARPPLGPSPFTSAPVATAVAASAAPGGGGAGDPLASYERALAIARTDDIMGWRRLVASARQGILPGLAAWWQKFGNLSPATEGLVEQTMEGVELFAPLIRVALAGVVSTRPRFKDQAGILENILHPGEWQRGGGFVRRVELPMSAAFVFQALHGSICMYMEDLATALKLARTMTRSPLESGEVPLWARHDVVMWPQALGQNATTSWKLISTLSERWPWVGSVFGSSEDYQAALLAYYIALNTLEFLEYLHAGQPLPDDPSKMRTDIPPVFEALPDDIKRAAYRLLVKCAADFRSLASDLHLDIGLIRREWPKWVAVQKHDLHQLYPFAMQGITQERLIPEIFGR